MKVLISKRFLTRNTPRADEQNCEEVKICIFKYEIFGFHIDRTESPSATKL